MSPPRLASRPAFTVLAMVLAVGAVAWLAYRDEEREAAAALEDFARAQAVLASSLAAELQTRLAEARHDAPVAAEAVASGQPTAQELTKLIGQLDHVERAHALRLLVLPPGATAFRTADGRSVAAGSLRRALQLGQPWLRLSHSDAARFGLPQRTALAGLARIDTGAFGHWGIAIVTTAERERDREERAQWRLLRTVLLASGIVVFFGGLALRNLRKELALQHELAIANVQRQRDERLERAGKIATMGTLAMGIAHEVSTPLGVIAGRAEQLVPRVASDERATRSVRAILEQVERIDQIIRSFLGLARGDSAVASEIEPWAIVWGAVSLVEHRFTESGVSLELDVAEGLASVHGDLRLLEHALVNLLRNACDACGRGGSVKVQVRTQGGTVSFVVEDDGHGISETTAARAQEPFFTTKRHGSGLGLAIASEIVKGHGGTLAIGSRSPRGTRACIELPPAKRASDAAA